MMLEVLHKLPPGVWEYNQPCEDHKKMKDSMRREKILNDA